jgi:hypothetical protein
VANIAQENRGLGKSIYGLIVESQKSAKRDRRSCPRRAFFRPISVCVDGCKLSAFSRDISETGIGLMHRFELQLGETEIFISCENGSSAGIRTRIVWCSPCGDGWYLSGGEFIGAPDIGL